MTTTLLVCADCRFELEGLGGVADTSPRELTPGRACDVHPTSRRVQAMHAVNVSDEVRAKCAASRAETVREVEAAPVAEDWAIVAQLAATLAATTGEPFSEDLAIVSVANARVLLRAARKGE